MKFSITVSESQVLELNRAIGTQSTRQAIYQAVSRTARAGATIIRRRVQEKLAIKNKYVSRAVTYKVDGGAINATGKITITQQLIPLIGYGSADFAATGSKAFGSKGRAGTLGISVLIDRGKAPIYLKHAFYATVGKGGHTGIFFRAKGRDKSGGTERKGTYKHLFVDTYTGGKLTPSGYARHLPIEEQFGPSVIDAFGAEALTQTGQKIMDDLAATMARNLQSQLERFQGGKVADDGE